MKCPNPKCHAELKPGAVFCQSCGTRVECCPEDAPKSGQPAEDVSKQAHAVAEAQKPKVECEPPVAMLCMDRLYMLIKGRKGTVRFKVNPSLLGAYARDIRFTFENSCRMNSSEGEEDKFYRTPKGREECGITFPAQSEAGDSMWYVTVECVKDGRVRVFEGEIRIIVGEKNESRKLAEHLVISIQNDIKTGHASDVNLSMNAIESLKNIVASAGDPYEALRDLADGPERAWAKVELFEVTPEECPTPKQVNPLPDGPARLTLKCGDAAIQLLSDRCVSFGRHRENMIPLIIFGPDGRKDRVSSEWISRFHFRIELAERCFVIYDGPSTNGTWVDNEMLDNEMRSKEIVPLMGGRAVRVDVGRSAKSLVRRYLELEFGFFCDSAGRSSGFVMTRRDGVPMKVVCVAEGGEVPVDDCRVSWNGHSWMLLRGRSPAVPIVVGSSVTIGEKTYEALPFHKTHIN